MATAAGGGYDGGGDGWASVLTSDKYVLFIVTTTERVRPAQPFSQSLSPHWWTINYIVPGIVISSAWKFWST